MALAKKIGARYAVLTAQHHDGYALFESKYMNAFTSKQTHNRDFVKEYVQGGSESRALQDTDKLALPGVLRCDGYGLQT